MRRCPYCDETFADDLHVCPLCQHEIVVDEHIQPEFETRKNWPEPKAVPYEPESLDAVCPECKTALLRDRHNEPPYCPYHGVQKESPHPPAPLQKKARPDPGPMGHNWARWALHQAGAVLVIAALVVPVTGLLSGADAGYYWTCVVLFAILAAIFGILLYLSAILPRMAYFQHVRSLKQAAAESREIDLTDVTDLQKQRLFWWVFYVGVFAVFCCELKYPPPESNWLGYLIFFGVFPFLGGGLIAVMSLMVHLVWTELIKAVGKAYALPESDEPPLTNIDLDPVRVLSPSSEDRITSKEPHVTKDPEPPLSEES